MVCWYHGEIMEGFCCKICGVRDVFFVPCGMIFLPLYCPRKLVVCKQMLFERIILLPRAVRAARARVRKEARSQTADRVRQHTLDRSLNGMPFFTSSSTQNGTARYKSYLDIRLAEGRTCSYKHPCLPTATHNTVSASSLLSEK